jgi:hypothetical protein
LHNQLASLCHELEMALERLGPKSQLSVFQNLHHGSATWRQLICTNLASVQHEHISSICFAQLNRSWADGLVFSHPSSMEPPMGVTTISTSSIATNLQHNF